MLGRTETCSFAERADGSLAIQTPPLTPADRHAYVFKLSGVSPRSDGP
jgi:hypothetical protein